jgi:hypothetical protein
MSVTINGTSGLVFNDASTQSTAATGFGFKNRIINGDMRISQASVGTAVTTTASFPVDRFRLGFSMDGACSVQQDTLAPTGFINSLKFTTTTADTNLGTSQSVIIQQRIEGTNISDLAWGTAGASPVTLSFWVRSSLTGTFGGSIQNSASNRSYPFSYTISAANTWEQKSVTISGDTSGTWLTTTDIGMRVTFTMGSGSSLVGTAGAWSGSDLISATGATSVIGTLNATWQITGVMLEKGSTATSYDYRPYTTELQLCQRYYTKTYQINIAPGAGSGGGYEGSMRSSSISASSYMSFGNWSFPVSMRATPTVVAYNPSNGNTNSFIGDGVNYTGVIVGSPGHRGVWFSVNGQSIGTDVFIYVAGTAAAEL